MVLRLGDTYIYIYINLVDSTVQKERKKLLEASKKQIVGMDIGGSQEFIWRLSRRACKAAGRLAGEQSLAATSISGLATAHAAF